MVRYPWNGNSQFDKASLSLSSLGNWLWREKGLHRNTGWEFLLLPQYGHQFVKGEWTKALWLWLWPLLYWFGIQLTHQLWILNICYGHLEIASNLGSAWKDPHANGTTLWILLDMSMRPTSYTFPECQASVSGIRAQCDLHNIRISPDTFCQMRRKITTLLRMAMCRNFIPSTLYFAPFFLVCYFQHFRINAMHLACGNGWCRKLFARWIAYTPTKSVSWLFDVFPWCICLCSQSWQHPLVSQSRVLLAHHHHEPLLHRSFPHHEYIRASIRT